MHIRTLPIAEVTGHLLIHNIVDDSGRKILKKGTLLTEQHVAKLRATAHKEVDVGILAEDDLHEDEAAARVAEALLGNFWHGLRLTRAVGGRVNVHTEQDGLLHVDVERLIALNSLPGVTLATRRQHATIGPSFETTQVATLKIIPYAIPKRIVEQAVTLAKGVLRLISPNGKSNTPRKRPSPPNRWRVSQLWERGDLEVEPSPKVGRRGRGVKARPAVRLFPFGLISLPTQRIALLITSEEASAPRIVRQFETPTRARLEKLGSSLTSVEAVELDETAIASAAQRLLASHDALIIGGQTSIMDIEDITPRALSHIGAEVVLHGAPVEPGNLLALAYYGSQWLLCAPGCAKSPSLNIVDFVLPRLIAGERLEEAEIAEMGLGGLL